MVVVGILIADTGYSIAQKSLKEIGPVDNLGPSASIGKRLWPKGTEGCSNSTFQVILRDGVVIIGSSSGNLGKSIGEKVDFVKSGDGQGMMFAAGQPTCRVEVIVRPGFKNGAQTPE